MSTSKKTATTTPAKKVAMKKVAAKKSSSKEEFTLKLVGANLIGTLKGKKYTRKGTEEEFEALSKKVASYNKLPTETKLKLLIKALEPEKAKEEAKKEETKAKVKGLKSQAKKIKKAVKSDNKEQFNLMAEFEKLVTEDETAIPKLQAILDKFKKVEEKAPEPVVTSQPRSGESYRYN